MLTRAKNHGAHDFDELTVPYQGLGIGSFSGSFDYDHAVGQIEAIYIEGWRLDEKGETIFQEKELKSDHPFYIPIENELLRQFASDIEWDRVAELEPAHDDHRAWSTDPLQGVL